MKLTASLYNGGKMREFRPRIDRKLKDTTTFKFRELIKNPATKHKKAMHIKNSKLKELRKIKVYIPRTWSSETVNRLTIYLSRFNLTTTYVYPDKF